MNTKIIRGIVTTTDAAAISPQGISCSPGKRAMATGMVLEEGVDVNVRAKRNSFHEKIKTSMAVVTIPDAERGSIIL